MLCHDLGSCYNVINIEYSELFPLYDPVMSLSQDPTIRKKACPLGGGPCPCPGIAWKTRGLGVPALFCPELNVYNCPYFFVWSVLPKRRKKILFENKKLKLSFFKKSFY